jgi:chemotaxis family two-component system sensor kinase Cph1
LQSEIEESSARIKIPALPVVAGDRIQLVQLLQNLVGNAIKYRGEQTPEIEIKVEDFDVEWLLSVSDNGIGFSMEYSEKIFM